MERERDVITWKDFIEDPSVTANTRTIRKKVVSDLAKSNGYESPSLLLDAIWIDQLTPYTAARKYIFGLIGPAQENGDKKPLKIGSISTMSARASSIFRAFLPIWTLTVLALPNPWSRSSVASSTILSQAIALSISSFEIIP